MLLSQVVDEFLDDNGLANAGAAEQTGLTALDERLDQVDGLDARLKDLGLRDQLVVLGSRTMDGHVAGDLGHGLLVNGLAHDVPDATQGLLADGHHDGMARIQNVQATDQTVGRAHGDGADDVARQVGFDLEDDVQVARLGVLASTVSAL